MSYSIAVTQTEQSRLSGLDFESMPFGRTFSDHMFEADYEDGKWKNPRIVPFGDLRMHPAMLALHYGQSIFEGMKAFKTTSGKSVLFRPEQHARRLNRSAARMSMPEFPEELFLDAVRTLVRIDEGWIPSSPSSALYLRPFMFANAEFIGVHASDHYKMIIFSCPVGSYYSKPLALWAEDTYVRAAVGGAGEAKAAGNYAAALLPTRLANQKGFDQILWLDAKEFKYVQEIGTMNIFFVIDGTVITPATDGAILAGITRDSLIQICKDIDIPVECRRISIDDLFDAHERGLLQEAFGVGTAAVVAPVKSITHQDRTLVVPPTEAFTIASKLKSTLEGIRSGKHPDHHGWIVPVTASHSV